nr:hypothetical protein [Tanacetum cinerariifolium]
MIQILKLHSENIHAIHDEVLSNLLIVQSLQEKIMVVASSVNHSNFDTINDLARKDLVRGLPRLKFEKDHLCSTCQLRKSMKYAHKPKSKNIIMEVLHTIHMDLYGPIRVQSINGKKYILVIVDDYSRFTWVMFLRSKHETPEFVIKFLKHVQGGLNKTVIYIQMDNVRTPSSTTIDQDAPSTSYSLSSSEVQAPISHQGVATGPTIKDNPFAQAEDDPFINVFAPEPVLKSHHQR